MPPVTAGLARPFWSVIVTVYNRTHFLKQCLDAVLDQAPPAAEMEILLADDSQAVNVRPLVDELGRGRVRHVPTGTRRRLYGNLNDALELTRGRWIHILHDDDFVLPGFYARMRQSVESLPATASMANCHYQNVREQGGQLWTPPAFREGSGLLADWPARLIGANPLNFPAVIYRREVFERVGKFREELPYAGDWEMYLRAALGFGWFYLPEDLARFRLHQGNLSWLYAADGQVATDIRRFYEIAEGYLPPEAGELLASVRQRQGQALQGEAAALLARGNAFLAGRYLQEAGLISPAIAASEGYARLRAALEGFGKFPPGRPGETVQ